MDRYKISDVALLTYFFLLFVWLTVERAVAWENIATHPAITQKAVERSILSGDYLKTQLGSNYDLNTPLELTGQFQNNINMRVLQEPEYEWDNLTTVSIKEWLKRGSSLEDVPNPRARHHFYDPLRNTGLDNSDADTDVIAALLLGSQWFYPDYWLFNATGLSALDRTKGLDGDWGNEYLNYYNWPYARGLFYAALTEQSESVRKANLGSMFVTLGHICHLLEDMGVPAHTRNDFVWGHLVADFYKDMTGAQNPWPKGGHPFEAWMEEQIRSNGEQIPNAYLDRLMATPPAFNKLADYWDKGICELSGVAQWQGDSPGWPATGFGNPPPEKSWGLAECTNYQFLSYSTIFIDSSLQSFPHPAKAHTRVDWYPTGPDGAKQYYRIGYDVPHLTRSTYTAYLLGDLAVWNTETTEEERVYEDYAKRTISRTVDYTTGLLNYFFRGRMELRSWVESRLDDLLNVTIYIKNKSFLEADPLDFKFTFKGGYFEVYWEDVSGSRYQVQNLTFSKTWNDASTLAYDEEMSINFSDSPNNDLENAVKFIVVYKGNIVKQPENEIDSNDTAAIAVNVIEAKHIHNIPTTELLLARFKDVDRDWFDPAVQFNNHGFLLTYNPSYSQWQANTTISGRQINIAPTPSIVNNRDRIFVDVKETYNGHRIFHSGSWDHLEYFPHIVENDCGIGTSCYGGSGDGICTVSLWNIPFWETGHNYNQGDLVGWDSPEGDCFEVYTCSLAHISASANQPDLGVDYWLLGYPDVEADLDIVGIAELSEESPGGTVHTGGPVVNINTLILSDWPDVWTNELNRGSATLEVKAGADKIRIWDNPDKLGQPVIDQSHPKKIWQLINETVPINLYVEGISISISAMDVRLKFTLNYAGVESCDKVNFTVQN